MSGVLAKTNEESEKAATRLLPAATCHFACGARDVAIVADSTIVNLKKV